MTVTAEQLRLYVGAKESEAAEVAEDLAVAETLLGDVLADAWRPVPDEIRDRLVLEVGHELVKRRDSPTGASQYADFSTGQPVAAPRDPLTTVWPIIRRYVGGF